MKDGKVAYYVNGADVQESNWMRFVNCSRVEEEQNLIAYQYRGEIFYRAYKDIQAGKYQYRGEIFYRAYKDIQAGEIFYQTAWYLLDRLFPVYIFLQFFPLNPFSCMLYGEEFFLFAFYMEKRP